MSGTAQDLRLTMADGTDLALTLHLPDRPEPQPCLVEALPYRKDDLTSSYTETYERLRDEFGFAVCRVDLRGTGSSQGDATDEYPPAEQRDLHEVIAWLASQPWCNGAVGMFGTSYSGFNSLQMACEQPPALKAICAIYATDDRWTDDVHWRGGALRLVDLVDYCHYMTPMTMLPPVPAVYGDGWREEWQRRLDTQEPWLLTWLRENRDGAYWRHGSVRDAGATGTFAGYERIEAATMIVAGWADGYRNSSFRTVAALDAAETPYRLLAGPWAHAAPTTAMPGPRIDLDVEMADFFDTWLRREGEGHRDVIDVFVRTSTRPEPDLDRHAGFWIRDRWPSAHTGPTTYALAGPHRLAVDPSVGTAAWIDCAGHLPWGQSSDQRLDDARSMTWSFPAPELPVVGQPRVRLRVASDAPEASVSVKLCDVFPDGTSALIARGTLDLRFRDGVHGPAVPLTPGDTYDVSVELDACAYRVDAGHTLRLSVAGADWPNTIAPPAPVTLTVADGTLELPLWKGTVEPDTGFVPGEARSSEDPAGVTWRVTDDVLRRTTTAEVLSESTYEIPHDGSASESYAGSVSVDRRTCEQRAEAETTFRLSWPGVAVRLTSSLSVVVTANSYDVRVEATAYDDDGFGEEQVAHRTWHETLPR